MPETLILEFTGVTEAEYAAVNKHLGIDMHTGQGDWPAGLLSHAAGTADDGTFVVAEVWSSRADQDAFMTSRLGAAPARICSRSSRTCSRNSRFSLSTRSSRSIICLRSGAVCAGAWTNGASSATTSLRGWR